MQSGIETLNDDPYPPTPARKRREWLNTAIEVALLWLAVIVVIACWR